MPAGRALVSAAVGCSAVSGGRPVTGTASRGEEAHPQERDDGDYERVPEWQFASTIGCQCLIVKWLEMARPGGLEGFWTLDSEEIRVEIRRVA
jgi:hypothetical protein